MGSDASRTERRTSLADSETAHILAEGSLALEGRLVSASNASFFGTVTLDGISLPCIYKPVAGERPLWDFPDGDLASRERAARLVSESAGWDVVPPTVLRDGRFGSGMVQHWIEEAAQHDMVDVVPVDSVRAGWIAVLEAEDIDGNDVLLIHADHPRLRDLAVFDAVVNNADRKGGHVLVTHASEPRAALDSAGVDPVEAAGTTLWGCDHGVSFHAENKLRTVLWGWAGDPLREQDVLALERLAAALEESLRDALAPLLTPAEIDALTERVHRLRVGRRMPVPAGSWRAIPWPPF